MSTSSGPVLVARATVPSGRAATSRIAIAVAAAAPALVMRFSSNELSPLWSAVTFGAGVMAAVALLMWAAEAARVDISGSLALAILALVAILPEYAVDIYFAYTAGHNPAYAAYATANMTGANRLLIGVAWPLLVAAAIFAARRRNMTGAPRTGVQLEHHHRTGVAFLAAATIYALVIPLTRRLAWYDTLVLGGLFALYLWRIRGSEEAEQELAGVGATVAAQPKIRRRLVVTALFIAAALIVLASAEPFGDSLVSAGAQLGIDEFLLVQWLAPIASEAPEVIVAVTFALRLRASDGMGALLAAKLNQWTLLIACLPIAYFLGGGDLAGLPLDSRQTEEFVLTTAQTLLGVAVLTDLRLTWREAVLLLGLFTAQFVFPAPAIRYAIAAIYALLAIAMLFRHRRDVPSLLRPLWPGRDGGARPRR